MSDSYSKWVMTSAFVNNTQAAINSGKQIEWVSVKTSDDTHSIGDLSGFNDITLSTASIKQTSNVSTVTVKGNTVTITGILNNASNTSDYYIRTLFLVARYNGTEFLAAATIANTASSAFRMPAASTTEITEFTVRPQISVTNVNTISTTVNPVAAATNERVNQLESNLQDKIDNINEDKKNLWAKLSEYVTKNTAETINGIKTFSQTIVGSITGNAGTATKLQNSRKINGVSFDGTADISVKASNDDKIVHNEGDQTIKGSLDIPIDNSMVRVGNDADIALVKKQGQGGTLVVGSGKTFRLQKSNNAKINTTDTLTDLLTVDQNGIVFANGFKGQNVPIVSTEKNVDKITNTGFYKVDSSYTGVPNGIPNGAFLEVKNFDGNLIYQILYARQISDSLKKATLWNRIIFNNTIFNWQSLSKDDDVVHNSGTETITGVKNFEVDQNSAGGFYANVGSDSTDNGHKVFWSRSDISNTLYGMSLGIGTGGNLIIGGGESPQNLLTAMSTGNVPKMLTDHGFTNNGEFGMFTADSDVVLISNYQNGGNSGKVWIFSANGGVYTPNGSVIVEDPNGKLTFKSPDTNKMTLGANIDGNAATASSPKSNGIPVNTNLNNIKTDGFYTFQSGSITNSPVLEYFSLTVVTIGQNNGTQTLIDSNTGVTWTRGWKVNGVFSEWTSNVPKYASVLVYGLGTLFDASTYLTFVKYGNVVTVYGTLDAAKDITGLNGYNGENLTPVGYRPLREVKSQISHNSSNGGNKVRGDVSYGASGNISIDDVTIGGSDVMNGTILKGTTLTFSATWVTS